MVAALGNLYTMSDVGRVQADLLAQGQARSLWGSTFIDLFFANTDFHDSMARRVTREPFAGVEISVLSIEDLLVCKVLFDRSKDWVDVEAVAQTRRTELDADYIRSSLSLFLADDDARFERLQQALGQAK